MILEYSPTLIQKRAAALTLVLLPMLLLGFIIVELILARGAHHERVAHLLFQREADQALLQGAPLWKSTIEGLRASTAGEPMFFTESDTSVAANAMQATATRVVSSDGGTVERSNVELVSAGDDAPAELRMTIAFTADIATFSHILYHLRQARPFLFVTTLAMHNNADGAASPPASTAPNRLQIDLTLVGYMQTR